MAAYEVLALNEATPQIFAPGTGHTYSMPRALAMTPETLTGSAATSALSITQTWNTTGTPTALDIVITDTASNASSRLLRCTSGGIVRLELSKTGVLTGRGNSSGTFVLASDTQFRPGSVVIGMQLGSFSTGSATGGGALDYSNNGTNPSIGWSNRGFALKSDLGLGWTSGTLSSNTDLELWRDAADTLALRRSTNAQALRIYNTYTDSSNYERVRMGWSANVFEIAPGAAGTGSTRVIHLSGLPTSNPGPGILWNNAGTPAIGT